MVESSGAYDTEMVFAEPLVLRTSSVWVPASVVGQRSAPYEEPMTFSQVTVAPPGAVSLVWVHPAVPMTWSSTRSFCCGRVSGKEALPFGSSVHVTTAWAAAVVGQSPAAMVFCSVRRALSWSAFGSRFGGASGPAFGAAAAGPSEAADCDAAAASAAGGAAAAKAGAAWPANEASTASSRAPEAAIEPPLPRLCRFLLPVGSELMNPPVGRARPL
ncbi:hypothetical protein [Streptomyces sp. WAC05950]|uniref:hypothetical protein n=1 Tax=Streptomyces sp. WAC05950 TaxID=2487419 RepID=UPI00163C2DD9|nr:hypothetical protein [Streptomyces sp. WAC05950]